MNEKALRTLEYDKIIQKLVGYAVSPMAKERAADLRPSSAISDIAIWQQETTEATVMALKKGAPSFGGFREIRPQLKRASMAGILSVAELMAIGEFAYVCRKVKNYARKENKDEVYPRLDEYFDLIIPLDKLENEISRCILSETEISDDASAGLRSVRKEIKISNDRVKDHLNGIINSSAYRNMLQDFVVTIRNDRYCVPVKAEYRSSFPGMIHDQSNTGSTLFMEPLSVIQLNNKIKELQAQEKEEIEKILLMLSDLVTANAISIEGNLELLTQLDFIFAKAALSMSMDATQPQFNTKGYIDIHKGRHPLLDPKTVVPTDIYLGKDFTTLLITGPNTGGKTVALKTLGLFTLMGQAGLHIPAFDNSELAVFDNVFADIGDEQSIEQSLSTFSAHMTNIVKIMDQVTDNSLVLFDELGAGTDPTEGAALAVAIIKALLEREIRTAVTTHYSELKVFALTTDHVENACCEFSVETLRPTYKLLIGIPGKSNAFAISKRLGLQDYILDSAKEFISQDEAKFEDVITDLEISKKSVKIEQERAEEYRREAEALKKEVERQKEKTKQQKEKILEKAREEVTILERQARVGKKLLATGNGRCNLSNTKLTLKNYHGQDARFADYALSSFNTEKTLEYFENLGLITVVEPSGKVYPLSDQAGSVVDVLRLALEEAGVEVRTAFEVTGLKKGKKGGFQISSKEESLQADSVIICCGGMAGAKVGGTQSGYELLKSMGHTMTKLFPVLVQIKTDPTYVKALKGVRADGAVLVERNGKVLAENAGEIQFTDFGVSGPAIFEISRAISTGKSPMTIHLNLMRNKNHEEIVSLLHNRKKMMPNQTLENFLTGILHNRLGRTILRYAGFGFTDPIHTLKSSDVKRIAHAIQDFEIPVIGAMGFDAAQVTAGGIRTEEFNPKTMESYLVPNLYAAGEVLDIDGDCGGFNLQWAWASGYFAGKHAAQQKKSSAPYKKK